MAIYSSQDSSIAPASAWLKMGRRCDPQVNHRPNSEVFKAQGPRFKPCRRNKNDHASSGSSINIGRNWMTTPWTKWAVAEELSNGHSPPSLNSTSGKEPLWSSTASARSETRDRRASLSIRQKSSFKWWICSWIVVSKVDAFYCHISSLDPMALHGSSMPKKWLKSHPHNIIVAIFWAPRPFPINVAPNPRSPLHVLSAQLPDQFGWIFHGKLDENWSPRFLPIFLPSCWKEFPAKWPFIPLWQRYPKSGCANDSILEIQRVEWKHQFPRSNLLGTLKLWAASLLWSSGACERKTFSQSSAGTGR